MLCCFFFLFVYLFVCLPEPHTAACVALIVMALALHCGEQVLCFLVLLASFQVRVVAPYLGPSSDCVVVRMIPDSRLPPRHLHVVHTGKTSAVIKWEPPYDSPDQELVSWLENGVGERARDLGLLDRGPFPISASLLPPEVLGQLPWDGKH